VTIPTQFVFAPSSLDADSCKKTQSFADKQLQTIRKNLQTVSDSGNERVLLLRSSAGEDEAELRKTLIEKRKTLVEAIVEQTTWEEKEKEKGKKEGGGGDQGQEKKNSNNSIKIRRNSLDNLMNMFKKKDASNPKMVAKATRLKSMGTKMIEEVKRKAKAAGEERRKNAEGKEKEKGESKDNNGKEGGEGKGGRGGGKKKKRARRGSMTVLLDMFK